MANLQLNTTLRVSIMLFALGAVSSLQAEWQPFHASYDVYRNGKLSGTLDVTFELDGDHWTMSSEGRGTHGMARFLRVQDNEYAQGELVDGRFRPQQYSHQTRVAGVDDAWTAEFDWPAGKVNIARGRKNIELEMGPQTLDSLSLKLEIQRRIRDQEPDLQFMLAGKDKIKEETFQVGRPERLGTKLGCLPTILVERINLGSTRYSRTWHASQLEFIMARLELGKSNGDDIEMQITALELGQEAVKPGPDCPAVQGGE